MCLSPHFVTRYLPNPGLKPPAALAPGIWGVLWEPGAPAPRGSGGRVGSAPHPSSGERARVLPLSSPPRACGQPQTSQTRQKCVQFNGKNAGHVVPRVLSSAEPSRCLRCCSVVIETNIVKFGGVFLDLDVSFPSALHEQKSCLPLSVLLIRVQTRLRDLQEKWEGSAGSLLHGNSN